jgi:tetratricopeptide (TPR) repeat protein
LAQISKLSRTRLILLFVLCLVGIGGYIIAVTNVYRAQKFATHSDQISIKRAIALDSQNADYHDLLCRGMMFVFQEASSAVEECRKASELNPYDSAIWLDLAQAYYLIGNKELNSAAIHTALAVDPTTPNTIWSVANFLLAHDSTSEALKQFSLVLQRDPSLAPATLNVCWRTLHDVNQIQTILPSNPSEYLEFIRILHSAGQFEQANQVWLSLMQLGNDTDYRGSLFYVDDLLQAHRAAQAAEAWNQLSKRSAALRAYGQPGNLIMDGSFTHEILNSGFDWRYNPNSQIVVALDTSDFYSGGRSLRLSYSGAGDDAGIFQYIAVRPDSPYLLSAWVKSDDLTTANGPALALVDAYSLDSLGATQETVGTTAWHRIETKLKTRPETQLLQLSIVRHPGNTSIHGNFWVDDIQFKPLDSQE